jgi:hypothetical protein
VSSTNVPAALAVYEYQIDAEAPKPPWFGSPVSRVAVRVELFARPEVPVIAIAPLNGSFTSAAIGVTVADTLEATPRPDEFTALTRKTWAVPTVSPRNDANVVVLVPSVKVVQVEPESVEYSTT